MAAKGDSKQGLVITLVFFVLLSIVLGVLTYLGFADQESLVTAEKKAKSDKAAMEKERDYYRWQSLAFRSYMGVDNDKDRKEMAVTMDQFAPLQDVGGKKQRKLKTDVQKDDRDTIDKVMTSLELELGWQENLKKPASTYKAEIARRDKEIEDVKGNVKVEQGKVADLNRELATAKKALEDSRAAFKEDLAKLRTEPLAYVLTYLKNLNKEELDKEIARVKADAGGRVLENQVKMVDDLQRELKTLGEQRESLQNEIGAQDERFKKLLASRERELNDLTQRLNKMIDKQPKPNFLDYDQPKAKIVEIDRSGNLPFINIGHADNVKAGLTFSIHGTDLTGKPVKDSKGSLEVLEVLGDRLSQARVTSLKDPNRNPIMKGDLLFNPSWSPHFKQHVAIAGLVDLTGEAQRDSVNQAMRGLLEFKRTLEDQGVIVDAYLDIKENAVKGEVTRQTDYLILGDVPDFSNAAQARDDDPKLKRNTNLVGTMTKMQQEAVHNGVTIISLRKFLAMSGYRVPRPVNGESPSINFRSSNTSAPTPLDRQPPLRLPADKPAGKDEKMDK